MYALTWSKAETNAYYLFHVAGSLAAGANTSRMRMQRPRWTTLTIPSVCALAPGAQGRAGRQRGRRSLALVEPRSLLLGMGRSAGAEEAPTLTWEESHPLFAPIASLVTKRWLTQTVELHTVDLVPAIFIFQPSNLFLGSPWDRFRLQIEQSSHIKLSYLSHLGANTEEHLCVTHNQWFIQHKWFITFLFFNSHKQNFLFSGVLSSVLLFFQINNLKALLAHNRQDKSDNTGLFHSAANNQRCQNLFWEYFIQGDVHTNFLGVQTWKSGNLAN